ncbi:MAG TPA: DoxX family protein [Chryseosolibacter sp.]|nr:DoxX family protein [Chryseosolibacter sp.]
MKTTKILYWTFTVLFGGFMLFSAIPNIMVVPESVTFINHLGYPTYIIPFLGVAKALGVIAIVVPGFPRIKEWAYAGLFYDLIGATYSVTCTEGFQLSAMVFMLVLMTVGALSYVYHHKRTEASRERMVQAA